MTARPSIEAQALAVWSVSDNAMGHAFTHERGGLGPQEFRRALVAAKITMHLIASDLDLRTMLKEKLAQFERDSVVKSKSEVW